MTYFGVVLIRECARCGADYSDYRDGRRSHAQVYDHWPRPVVDEPEGGDSHAEPDPV